MNDSYLWDKTGTPDPFIDELVLKLTSARRPRRSLRRRTGLVVTGALAAALFVAVFLDGNNPPVKVVSSHPEKAPVVQDHPPRPEAPPSAARHVAKKNDAQEKNNAQDLRGDVPEVFDTDPTVPETR